VALGQGDLLAAVPGSLRSDVPERPRGEQECIEFCNPPNSSRESGYIATSVLPDAQMCLLARLMLLLFTMVRLIQAMGPAASRL